MRNAARPFAELVFHEHLSGSEPIRSSEPTRSRALNADALDAAVVYLMLHGSDLDTSRFWGELDGGGVLEALEVGNIPDLCTGVVFAGSCWGALTVRTAAIRYRPADPVPAVTPEQSIALQFLRSGARAFVGCTGAHYSPVQAADNEADAALNYFGAPMHRAFFAHLRDGRAPADALFRAKLDYIRDMPHGRKAIEEQAIENKILRQFTCLGLGW